MPARHVLTPGRRALRDLCRELMPKLVRLRNKADLVAGEPEVGRNLTALRNTAAEVEALLALIQEPRCLACGCTENDCGRCIAMTGQPCRWARPGLCSACAGG